MYFPLGLLRIDVGADPTLSAGINVENNSEFGVTTEEVGAGDVVEVFLGIGIDIIESFSE